MSFDDLSTDEYIQLLGYKNKFAKILANGLFDTLNIDKANVDKQKFYDVISSAITNKILFDRPVIINSCPDFLTDDMTLILFKLKQNGFGEDCLNNDEFISANSKEGTIYKHRRYLENDVVVNNETGLFEEVSGYRYDTEVLMGDCDFGIYNIAYPITEPLKKEEPKKEEPEK